MFSQLFGKYLVEKNIISKDDYKSAIEGQMKVRVKLGTIAIADGLLTETDVENINKLQMQFDKRFGDIAVEKGLLTDAQVDALLKKQGNPYMQFIQVLMEQSGLTATILDKTLDAFQKEHGYSDSEIDALKTEDIDSLMPIFAFSAKPYVTDIASLVVRNINRFITRDFYVGRIQHVKSFNYYHLAGQKITGNDTIYIALAEENGESSFAQLATAFSGESYDTVSDDAYDAVCEFINVSSGLFAAELSKKEIEMNMEPTFAYKDQSIEGDFYILPIYIDDHKINLVIAINNEVSMGKTPYAYTKHETIVYDVKDHTKGTVLLVDDSKMSRKVLRNLLEEAGYSILAEATNGAEAVEAYKKQKPDLVTLDITMPVMDGIEALKNLVAYDADVKVIMITAAGQQSKLIQALKIGAKKFITKPFDKDEIVSNVSELMSE